MIRRDQLDWIQERRGQLKVQMVMGEFKLIAEWEQTGTGERLIIVTGTDDEAWWDRVQELDEGCT